MERITSLFSSGQETRLYFATDIHGSETCWRKFLNSGKHYEADVMVLGGDMTGKAREHQEPGAQHRASS